ncbi:3-phosphoshikimate 1-carboxyvinyltransferase [Streptococcus uberis]|uniref:3-phosphoshikimate 1-carboxyvinyltransferase n=1 Tax=Streptococcus uberis TaxID=1349 RepID=UPI0022B87EAE|nr:3-phosphoshikimate 1-carboxyvinyltransferase [Streptococcus uberis]MCZ8466268.1 3-phosphoshikimate 1-carboxyvinyltransferase [Streptococcus uberis]
MKLQINAGPLKGTVTVLGDKSISHRALIFGSIAEGKTEIKGLLKSQDVQRTLVALQHLGVTIEESDQKVIIHGKGFSGLTAPDSPLDMGNSGTSLRLLAGLLSGQDFPVQFFGDASLSKRPMDRIVIPLREMGARLEGQGQKHLPPITVLGSSQLTAINYQMPVASAQVKSAILLAAIQTKGQTQVFEKAITRNHTEVMIKQFGGDIFQSGKEIRINGPQTLKGQSLTIPGDISSAAFWIVAALIIPGSAISIKNVGINPTRTGIIDLVKKMGGVIEMTDKDDINQSATIHVSYSKLKGTRIAGEMIPRLIDELPIIALLATQAEGTTVVQDAQELRVKETDRIQVVTSLLRKMGADIEEKTDGFVIKGKTELHSCQADAFLDHRIGMMVAIAALLVKKGEMILNGEEAIQTSYPQFFKDLESLQHD